MRPYSSILCALWAPAAFAAQPWLDKTLPFEDRLRSFIAQLNDTQKYAMIQGDTEVSHTLTRPR